MADGIVDNAPEMDLNDPKFADMLAGVKVEPKAEVKPDVKPKIEPASSADETKDEDESTEEESTEEDDSPEKLKARVRGLQAELTRRKGNSEKVGELELKLAEMRGQLEQLSKSKTSAETNASLEDALRKLDDRALISKQTDWDDELADARARYAAAEERGDDKAMEKNGQRITYAKKVISAIRGESLDRTQRKQDEAEQARTAGAKVKDELDGMYSSLKESFPDFEDNTSDLWKAGDAEYKAHPEMMRRLGAAGEVVAAALAVIKNPDLIGQRSESETRREVVSKLETGLKKAFKAGAASPTTGRSAALPTVNSAESLQKFNEMVDRIKGGGYGN